MKINEIKKNHEDQENQRNPIENHENHENRENSCEDQENHGNQIK